MTETLRDKPRAADRLATPDTDVLIGQLRRIFPVRSCGKWYVGFSLVVDNNGDEKWHRVVLTSPTARQAATHLQTGTPVKLIGLFRRMQVRNRLAGGIREVVQFEVDSVGAFDPD